MPEEHDLTRRRLLTALAGLSLANVRISPSIAAASANTSDTLVAYFSRSGNTRVIAGIIHRHLQTTLFEIVPSRPYPEDYFQTVAQATKERERNILPPLAHNVAEIARYRTIYLGFPIWGTTVPASVKSFLSSHDLSDKTLIPFITHGGYGPGDSEAVLAQLAPAAKREKPLVIECSQERKTTQRVTDWLEKARS